MDVNIFSFLKKKFNFTWGKFGDFDRNATVSKTLIWVLDRRSGPDRKSGTWSSRQSCADFYSCVVRASRLYQAHQHVAGCINSLQVLRNVLLERVETGTCDNIADSTQ